MSVNRIMCNRDNLARDAAIAASAQRASTDIRLISQSRTGGGQMAVTGPYSGVDDAYIDIEITSGTGGDLVASQPVVRGVGSGALTVESIDVAAVPDTITLALADKGSAPVPAELEFFGATLAAKTPGLSGNDLGIMVTRNLTLDPTQYSTLEAITADTVELIGDAWNWGQPQGNGIAIPAQALRIQFAGFPTVHRTWKTWSEGKFVYRLDPAPIYDIPENTRIIAVSGGYDLALSDGTNTETYADIITVYDFLSAVDTRSALAEVRGVIAYDTAPGGMAITDIPLRTDAHSLPPLGGKVVVDEVAPDAPTENIILHPLGQTSAGQWTVSGEVTGTLPSATSGVPYKHGPVHFTLPPETAVGVNAGIDAVYKPLKRTGGAPLPSICFKPLLLGVAATDKRVIFTWTRLDKSDCHCERKPALRISLSCLGLTGGDDEMLDPEFQTRLETLFDWRREFTAANTTTGPDALTVVQDLDFADRITGIFSNTIEQAYGEPAACTLWDSYFEKMKTELAVLYGIDGHLPPMIDAATQEEEDATAALWATITGKATTIQGGQTGSIFYNTANKHYYRLDVNTVTQVSGSVSIESYPTLPLTYPFTLSYNGSTVTEPRQIQPFPIENWAVGGSQILTASVRTSESTSTTISIKFAYTDLGMAPDAEEEEEETGGENLRVDRTDGSFDRVLEQLARRYVANMDHVLAVGGIVPKSDASSSAIAGDGCWRDPGHDYAWTDDDGNYLPIFNNEPYVSSRRVNGEPRSTREFGVGVVTDCEHRLIEGDKIVITINGAGTADAAGDIVIPVIAAAAAQFSGGADGDSTQTWTVRSAIQGSLPDWPRPFGSAVPHAAGAITVRISDGAIAWEVGDAISVSLEGGTLRWRRDDGAWNDEQIFGSGIDMGDGLTLTAAPGAAPSFVAGDTWRFQAVATHGVSRLRAPVPGNAFAWDGDAAQIDIDLGSTQQIESILLALHTLPPGALVTLIDADGAWSVPLVRREGAMLAMLPAGSAARHVRISITGAGAGAAIGWIFIGAGWEPSVGASELTMQRRYGLARGEGLNPSALYRGRGNGGRWRWNFDNGGALLGENADDLVGIIDYVAAHGLEPVCLVPDLRRPDRAALAVINADEISLTEYMQWQAEGVRTPVVSVDLPFRAVIE
ncbi:MAG: hypothetical protein LBF50_08865 [Azoarcus sp.]|nr:hypothetical protein [Azoarcus sp.]